MKTNIELRVISNFGKAENADNKMVDDRNHNNPATQNKKNNNAKRLLLLMLMLLPAFAFAQYAINGSGYYKNQIFWLPWNDGKLAELNKINGSIIWTSNDGLPQGVELTMTVTAMNGAASVYTSGTDANDTFDDLFNGLSNNAVSTPPNALLSREVTVQLTVNGASVSPRMVFADAGNSTADEYLKITRQGTDGWYFLEGWDRTNSSGSDYTVNISGTDRNIAITQLTGTDNASPVGTYLLMAPALSAFSLEMNGKPATAVSMGLFLPIDYSDVTGFASAAHLIERIATTSSLSAGTFGTGATNDGQIFPDQNPGSYWPITKVEERIRLGFTVDADPSYTPNDQASGDDLQGTDDEESIPVVDDIIIDNVGNYSLTCFSYNNSGTNANLLAWIDFNQNGLFEDNEAVNNGLAYTIPSSAVPSITSLVWDLSQYDCAAGTIKAGRSYLRVRLTTNSLLDSRSDLDGRSLNIALNGEVEDHLINITGYDYGDLPVSFGSPSALVNTDADKDGTPDNAGSIWLGNSVSYSECSPLYSTDANGDSGDDGLMVPDELIAGQPADWIININSQASVFNAQWGIWFDWDGNGSFTDASDGFYSGASNVSTLTPVVLNVTPPSTAVSTFGVRVMVRPEAQGAFAKANFDADITNGEIEDSYVEFPLKAYIIDQKNVPCFGGNTGEVTIEATGGTPPYEFSFNNESNYSSTVVFSNLTAGNYTVYVRDAAGDKVTVPVNITHTLNAVVATVDTKTDVLCVGATTGNANVTASGGTPPYRFFFNGETIARVDGNFVNLSAGSYPVIVRDANDCETTATITITEPAQALQASIQTKTDAGCFGSATGSFTISATGGIEPYNYSIDGGTTFQVTNIFSNLEAKAYPIQVKDANNCTVDLTASIDQPLQLIASLTTKQDVKCTGTNSGSVTVSPTGGTPPYRFTIDNWATENNTGTFNNLVAGNYTIGVKDAKNCETTVTATITEPLAALQASVDVTSNVDCFGNGTGSANISATGGVAPYQFFFNNETTPSGGSYVNLQKGSYPVLVRDANGCETNVTITISGPDAPLTASASTIVPPLCSGAVNGSATITASGGTPDYTYSLNGGAYQTIATFAGLSAGNHLVTVKDAKGCTFDVNFNISQPDLLTLTAPSIQNIKCFNTNTGEVTLTANGGTTPYQYDITNGTNALSNSTGQFTNLPVGSYTAKVTDVNLCEATTTFTISEPLTALQTSVISKTDVDCNNSQGSFTVDATGGVAPYSFSLDGATAQPTGIYTNLAIGSYVVTITDAAGCEATQNITIQDLTNIDASLTADNMTICESNPVSFTASGGDEYEFLVNGILVLARSAAATYSNSTLQPGDVVTAEVYNTTTGCHKTSNPVTITVHLKPVVTLAPMSNVCNTGTPFALAGGLPAGGTYSGTGITNGQFNPAVAGAGVHVITYTYTNSDGCQATASTNLTVDNCNLSLTKKAHFNDENGNNRAEIGETITYQFTIQNGGNTDLTNLIITDPLVTVSGGALALLPAGGSDNSTFSATFVLTLKEIDAAKVSNQATVAAIALGTTTLYDLSDDPDNSANVDADNDGEPDDVTVTNLNVVPVVVDDNVAMDEDNQLNIDVLDNDSFGGNGPSSSAIVITVQPLYGQIRVDVGTKPNDPGDDIIVYTPDSDYFGSDSFTYQICDTDGDCATATVNITVRAVNDPPVYDGNNYTTMEYHPIDGNILQDVTDIDNLHSDLTINTTPVSQPANGTVTLQSNGNFIYTPKMDFIGRDYFDVQICDNGTPNECITERIYFDVTPADDCELLVPNAFSPDGDGINETFKIRCLYQFPEAHLQVFSRWGSLVYEKKNYGNGNYWPGTEWWDGRSNNSWALTNEVLPSATYVYILYLGNGEIKKGTLFLKSNR